MRSRNDSATPDSPSRTSSSAAYSRTNTTLLDGGCAVAHSPRTLEDCFMRVFVAEVLIASAAVSALAGCVSSPPVTQGYGLLTYPCYSALTRPLLPAEVPGVSVVAGYGALTGVVFRAGTGTGIDSA